MVEEQGRSTPGGRPWTPADYASAVALVGCVALLYHLTLLSRFSGDGAGLCNMYVLGGSYYNVLYLPAVRLLDALVDFESPFGPLQYLSVWCAALGTGFTFLVCRWFGATLFGALVATTMLVTSPALWLYGTSVEVHALHFLAASFAAFVTVALPWERLVLSLAITALVFPIVYLAHQTGVLVGPGWVLLVAYARSRRAAPLRWRTLLLVVGPTLLAGLGVAIWAAGRVLEATGGAEDLSTIEMILRYRKMPVEGSIVWMEWANPLRLLLPLAAAGALLRRPEPLGLAALLVLLGVPMAFFFWWGIPEEGGYFLGNDTFLCCLAAGAFSRPRPGAVALATLLVAAQAVPTRLQLDDFDRGFPVDERIAMVREAWSDDALFVSTVDYAPSIRVWIPDADVHDLRNTIALTFRNTDYDVDLELLTDLTLDAFHRSLETHDRIVLDTGYLAQHDRAIDDVLREAMGPIVERVRAEFDVEERDHPYWSLLIVRERGS